LSRNCKNPLWPERFFHDHCHGIISRHLVDRGGGEHVDWRIPGGVLNSRRAANFSADISPTVWHRGICEAAVSLIGSKSGMGKSRLEAFSDGVIAIIITIMVLEMKVPHGDSIEALTPLIPVFCSYVLSFLYLGIYWNNHHHMLHACREATGPMLWANLHLLFWLSLIPFATGWMGENHFAAAPAAVYGAVLFMAAVAYWILQQQIIAAQGEGSILKQAIGGDWKGKLSPILYAVAIALASWANGCPLAFMCWWRSFGSSQTDE
jgi:TMEM175 potassium channel family protein